MTLLSKKSTDTCLLNQVTFILY
uniref:Uncharacterized protein n=1 Tax=Lepeophtheirus salmonis TaxID=72036 RepID=A0A0K2UUZ2_LEPSM